MNSNIKVNVRGACQYDAATYAMDLARSRFSIVEQVEEPDGTFTVTLWPIPTDETLYGMVRDGYAIFDPVATGNAEKRHVVEAVNAKYGERAPEILEWIAGGNAANYFAQRTLDERRARGA